MSAESEKETNIAPEVLLSKLSYSHFIELVRDEDSLERLFYEVESFKNNWSVRELKRAINILCTNKNDTLVKYITANMEDQLFVSKYLLKPPDKKALEDTIREGLDK